MSQPVKLSDALVLDARIAATAQQRSIAGQVEFWARLGRSMELLLTGEQTMTLLRKSDLKTVTDCLDAVGTPEGEARLEEFLDSQPFPHFNPHPDRAGVFIRTEADGTTTLGRFVKREFVEVEKV